MESDDVEKEDDEDDVDDVNVAEGDERIMLVVLALRRMRWKLMMLRILRSRGRKMMMLRLMMCARKIDPNTETHAL